MRKRKYVTIIMALGTLAALTVAGLASAASSTEKAVVGNLVFEAGGGFSPKALPKNEMAPIELTVEGKISTLDGSHPPALKEALVETDKNGSVFVKGYPVCKASQIESTDTKHAEAACKSALIGTGTTTATVAFPESADVLVNSKLLVFNGGEKGGVVTFYIHAYFSNPVPGAIVTTVKIKKIHNGRYGLLSTATIPKIAGGSGSVKTFKLKIGKKYTYKGKKVSILNAKCSDGKLQAHATAIFSDGTRASTEFIRTCTPKG